MRVLSTIAPQESAALIPLVTLCCPHRIIEPKTKCITQENGKKFYNLVLIKLNVIVLLTPRKSLAKQSIYRAKLKLITKYQKLA